MGNNGTVTERAHLTSSKEQMQAQRDTWQRVNNYSVVCRDCYDIFKKADNKGVCPNCYSTDFIKDIDNE